MPMYILLSSTKWTFYGALKDDKLSDFSETTFYGKDILGSGNMARMQSFWYNKMKSQLTIVKF